MNLWVWISEWVENAVLLGMEIYTKWKLKKNNQEISLAYQFYGCISNLDENSFHDEKLTVHASELLLQNKRKGEV